MTTLQVVILVSVFVLVDGVVVFFLVPAMVRESWGKIAAAFPAQQIDPSAVRKSFQSVSTDYVNFGWSVHVAADERYLHLRPALLGRVCRARPASVPWEEIRGVKKGRWFDTVTIRGVTVKGPPWALGLAA